MPLWAERDCARGIIYSAGHKQWYGCCRRVEWLLLLLAVEAESWGCSAEPGASLLALERGPRLLLVHAVGLDCEFLELYF